MIGDERLKIISEAAPVQDYDTAYITLSDIKEMAKELLAYRQAERAIWENAPEWANWFAHDAGWFFQRKPKPGDNGEWEPSEGLMEPANHDGWKSTLQGRQK